MAGGRDLCSGSDCNKTINTGSKSAVNCKTCRKWLHKSCAKIGSAETLSAVKSGEINFICEQCTSNGEVMSCITVNQPTEEDSEDLLDSSIETTIDSNSLTISSLNNRNKRYEIEIKNLNNKVTTLEATVASLVKMNRQAIDRMNLNNLKQIKIDEPKQPSIINFSRNVIKMKQGDILATPSNVIIGHCVARDLKMSDGLAAQIKAKFNINTEEIYDQAKVGEAILHQQEDGRKIIHLVTKEDTHSDPIWKNF